MNILKKINGKVQDFKFLSNLPIFHSSICWFNNEGFVFLSFFSVLYNSLEMQHIWYSENGQ